ncbi:MAG TPA: glycosyltransferase family 4 protein [Rikenellaceae bacterium]|nr:glycosyltransferase family 4 protein [Rikenellaceae bacterium]
MAIKIAYCIPSLFSVGGMEKVLTLKANYFTEVFGYDVTIILTDGKNLSYAFPLSDKVKVINLDINYKDIWSYKFFHKFISYSYKQRIFQKRLTKVLFEIKPDITISMLRREINFITKIKDGSKKVGELHFNRLNYRDFNTQGRSKGIKSIMSKLWMEQLIHNLKKVDKFVVLSYEDMARWVELTNVCVIYDPLAEFPEYASDCTSKKVIAAGRFVNQKGFDMLLDSWKIVSKKHPEWILNIYGSGNTAPLLKQIKRNKIDKSCFLHNAVLNINDKYRESSIFAFSSRFEGFGMVITEAMSCGIPPVAFACQSGPKEIITDGVNGILVPPEDVTQLANKICYLIENENIRKEMGAAARRRAEDFRIEKIAKEWDNLFRNLLSESN